MIASRVDMNDQNGRLKRIHKVEYRNVCDFKDLERNRIIMDRLRCSITFFATEPLSLGPGETGI